MADKSKQQQARKDAALAIRVLCAAAGGLVKATQVLAEEKNHETNPPCTKPAMLSDLFAQGYAVGILSNRGVQNAR